MLEDNLKYENCSLGISEKSARDKAKGLEKESFNLQKQILLQTTLRSKQENENQMMEA